MPAPAPDAKELMQSYLAFIDQEQDRLSATKPTDAWYRRRLKSLFPRRARGAVRLLATDVMSPISRRRARRLAQTSEPLLLHLGSGGEHKAGYINIDLVGDPVEVPWNLARGIPFDSDSVDGIFHEHLLEHIDISSGYRFMQNCHRVLKTGGILRVVVPDAGAATASYAGQDDYLTRLHPGRPTPMLGLQELFYWHRHRTMYDADTLSLMFRASGFPEPRLSSFEESELSPVPDTPGRAPASLYMEAQKP